MSLEEQVKKLSEIVVLQAQLIDDCASALDNHDLGGPHYLEIHKLRDLITEFKNSMGEK